MFQHAFYELFENERSLKTHLFHCFKSRKVPKRFFNFGKTTCVSKTPNAWFGLCQNARKLKTHLLHCSKSKTLVKRFFFEFCKHENVSTCLFCIFFKMKEA